MSATLKQITLKGFRGATLKSTVPFNQGKKITMIFGENGTGKTSLFKSLAGIVPFEGDIILEEVSCVSSFSILFCSVLNSV